MLFRSLIQIYNEEIQFYSKESSGIQGESLNQDKFADLLLLLYVIQDGCHFGRQLGFYRK